MERLSSIFFSMSSFYALVSGLETRRSIIFLYAGIPCNDQTSTEPIIIKAGSSRIVNLPLDTFVRFGHDGFSKCKGNISEYFKPNGSNKLSFQLNLFFEDRSDDEKRTTSNAVTVKAHYAQYVFQSSIEANNKRQAFEESKSRESY